MLIDDPHLFLLRLADLSSCTVCDSVYVFVCVSCSLMMLTVTVFGADYLQRQSFVVAAFAAA